MTNLQVNLGIHRIALQEFIFTGIDRESLPDEIQWKFGTKSVANLEHRQLAFLFTTWVHPTEDSDPFLQLTVEMVFDFEDLPNYLTSDGTILIPPDLRSAILGIVISTTRGILFAKLVGTSLEGLTLPIVDPMKLVSDQPIARQNALSG